jgi:hypothetical protein
MTSARTNKYKFVTFITHLLFAALARMLPTLDLSCEEDAASRATVMEVVSGLSKLNF